MFHPRPFLFSRFPPQGVIAVIRAHQKSFLDIYFRLVENDFVHCIAFLHLPRMHAEFQLNIPPYHPFWYTPAQFQGRLILRDDASELTYFRMYVPNEKKLNIGKYLFHTISFN